MCHYIITNIVTTPHIEGDMWTLEDATCHLDNFIDDKLSPFAIFDL